MSDEFSDYIVYVDESGDPNLSNINPVFPMFCLSFCVVAKNTYVKSIVPSFQNFKFKYFGHDLIVLHEHEIRKSKGKFTLLLTNAELRQQFYSDLSQLMEDADMKVIAGVIRKSALVKSYKDPYDPYRLALLFCMENLLSFLSARGQKDKVVDVIFESRGRNEDRELEGSLEEYATIKKVGDLKLLIFDNVISDPFSLLKHVIQQVCSWRI